MRTTAPCSAWIAAALFAATPVTAADTLHAPFVRHALPVGSTLPTLTPEPWRFGFEHGLYADGADLVLVRGDATSVRLVPDAPSSDGTWRWVAADSSGHTIEGGSGRHLLRDAQAATIAFERGRPVEASQPGRGATRWHYLDDALVAVSDGRGNTLSIVRDAADDVTRIELPDGGRWLPDGAGTDLAAPRSAVAAAHCPVDEVCDATASPPEEAFAAGSHVPGAATRDLRPASCRSYFVDYYGTVRGERIEDALVTSPEVTGRVPTVTDFPVVDFVSATELVSVRSRDLSSPTYTNASRPALFDQLMRDGRDARRLVMEPLRAGDSVEAQPRPGELGVITRIDAQPPRRFVLELVVRHGAATPDQIEQIRRAREELATRHGIELRVVEIP